MAASDVVVNVKETVYMDCLGYGSRGVWREGEREREMETER